MKINYDPKFTEKLERQIQYIAGDKPIAAKKFRSRIINNIKKIPKNPWMNRKSYYFDDLNIRDLITEGYSISYKIEEDEIVVFGFLKWEEGY
jgi:plasmid stabilization system protein ParE